MPPLLGMLVISGCLGALIGLIRQWSEQTNGPTGTDDFGGVRTYTLWALLGCVSAYASREYTPLALPIVIAVLGTHQVFFRPNGQPAGNTRFASFLVTLMVGSLLAWEQRQAAVLMAAATMVIVGVKQPLHDWTRRFTPQDIRGTLQFVAITGVILPLVPDRTFGPYNGFNPYSTWLMVILISGLGFTGYIAIRLLGAGAGILLTSVLGGLASSTASTLAFSRRSREEPDMSVHYAFAVVVACTVMLPRVGIAVAVISPALAQRLAPALGLMAVPAIGYGLWWWLGRRRRPEPVAVPVIGNPLSLTTAVKFALLYAAVAYLVKIATTLEWSAGMLPLSFVSGLTDMDAISLSMANSSSEGQIDLGLAAQAIVLGAVANSMMKAGLAISLGSPRLRLHVGGVLVLTATVGAVACWMIARGTLP
ncbi:MAG: MgtC/SapB family protein [Opitutaceae bacterium]